MFIVNVFSDAIGRDAGSCGHCRPPVQRRLRYGRESTEAAGRVRENVSAEVEEPVLRSVENWQLMLLSGTRTKISTCL